MKHFKIFFVFLTAGILFVTTFPLAFANQGNAETTISSAKTLITSCYNAAKEAEAEGANITALMRTLNEAGRMLSQAELANSIGEYDLAVNYASQSSNKLNGFISEANSLKVTAVKNANQNFTTILLSLIGSLGILGAGTTAWISLKRKERRTNSNGSSTI